MSKYIPPHKRQDYTPAYVETTPIASVTKKYIPPHRRVNSKTGGQKMSRNILHHTWDHSKLTKPGEYQYPASRIINQYLKEYSEAFCDLKAVKCTFGSNPLNDGYFLGKWEKKWPSSKKRNSKSHLSKYYEVFIKMNMEHKVVDIDLKKFADICCAPGGFAKAVLDIARNCVGEGLTIHPDDTGIEENEKVAHALQLRNSSRWKCIYRDVMKKPEQIIFFGEPHSCGLVIVDGNFLFKSKHLEANSNEEREALSWFNEMQDKELHESILNHFRGSVKDLDKETAAAEKLMGTIHDATDKNVDMVIKHYVETFRARAERGIHMSYFLLSRMLVGLKNLQDRGTMLVQNGTRPSLVNVWLWGILIELFDEVIVIKANLWVHSINSSAYFLCKGYNLQKAKEVVIPLVREIMGMLKRGRRDWVEEVISGKLELYSGCSDLEDYMKFKGRIIAKTLEPAWRAQSKRLQEINKS